jgi:hypothetical protein
MRLKPSTLQEKHVSFADDSEMYGLLSPTTAVIRVIISIIPDEE